MQRQNPSLRRGRLRAPEQENLAWWIELNRTRTDREPKIVINGWADYVSGIDESIPSVEVGAGQSHTVTDTSSGWGSATKIFEHHAVTLSTSGITFARASVPPCTANSTLLTGQTSAGRSFGLANVINDFHFAAASVNLPSTGGALYGSSGTTVVQNFGSSVTQYDPACTNLSAFPYGSNSWVTGVGILAVSGLNYESGPQAGGSQPYGAVLTGTAATDLHAKTVRVAEAPEHVINKLFSMEPMPDFEDGVSNTFSEGIEYILQEYGNMGIAALENVLVQSDKVSCIAETLRTLGLVDNVRTAEGRFRILVRLLRHSSAVVRDGAAIGLAYLDDEKAVPEIDKAIEQEPLPFLRRDMEAIREQLAHR
jgi:hypothetical protein